MEWKRVKGGWTDKRRGSGREKVKREKREREREDEEEEKGICGEWRGVWEREGGGERERKKSCKGKEGRKE
jgi:hypothetical protein